MTVPKNQNLQQFPKETSCKTLLSNQGQLWLPELRSRTLMCLKGLSYSPIRFGVLIGRCVRTPARRGQDAETETRGCSFRLV